MYIWNCNCICYNNIVYKYNCGLVADSFNIENMANKINSISIDKINEYKCNSDKAAKILCFENESRKIKKISKTILDN